MLKKKLKASTTALLVAGGLLIGGTTGYAASNYYADLLDAQKDDLSAEVMAMYDEAYEWRNKQVHNDLVTHVEQRRQEVLAHFEVLIQERVNEEAEQRQQEHAKAVDEAYNQIIAEIEAELDERIANEMSE